MMETNHEFCIHCGEEIYWEAESCPLCSHKLGEKENLFLYFLISHTKDSLKGKAQDKVYEILKNYLLSHLYGLIVTITLVATVTTGVMARQNQIQVDMVPTRPESVASVRILTDLPEVGLDEPGNVEPETTVPETTVPEVTEPVLPEITYDFDSQAAVILANQPLWEKPSDYSMYQYYYVTDLDQDGLLEINTEETAGSGIFTTRIIYEVNETMDGLVPVSTPFEYDCPDGFISLESGTSYNDLWHTGYYDPQTGICYFLMSDVWRAGWAANGRQIFRVAMIDNAYQAASLAHYEHITNEAGDEEETFTVGDIVCEDEEEFYRLIRNQFSGMKPFRYSAPGIGSSNITSMEDAIRSIISQWSLTTEGVAEDTEIPNT